MHSDISDISLLQAWQQHQDAEAFHAIVKRHARLVYNTCRHILRNDADAADVSQECFLSLATSPPEIQYSLSAWLHRVATHRSLDHLKAANRRRAREVRFVREAPELLHPETDDLLSLIDETIDGLPDDLRLPLVDHFFRHKSHQEVAEEYGIPRRTISYRINTGVEQLRAALNNRGIVAPVTGIAAFLEWQRAEAESLPEGLYAKLCKYAIAGAPQKGRIHRQKVAYESAGMSGVILVLLSLTATLVIAGWLLTGGRFLWQAAPPVAALEIGELHAEVIAAPTAAIEIAKVDDSTIERAAAAEPMAAMAGKVTGRVYDADTDAPIAGAEIKIAKDTDTYNPVTTCTTDADGQYESVTLPPGAYVIYRGNTPGYGATSEKMDTRGTRLPKSEVDGIRFRLTRNANIDLPVHKGLVVSGVVVDALGNGIPNATVSARTRFQNNGQSTKTASDGTFFLAGFSSTYDFCMTVYKRGFGRRNFTRLNLGFPGLANWRIELPIAAEVSGKVMQTDGTPLANAHVMAVHESDVKRWPLDFPEAHTDMNGHYTIKDLGAGTYALQVFSGKYNLNLEPHAKIVNLVGGDSKTDADITMETLSGFNVSGVVLEPDGAPIANQLVTLYPGPLIKTDADGKFFTRGLKAGKYPPHPLIDGFPAGYKPGDNAVDPEVAWRKMGGFEIDRDRNDIHIVLRRNAFTLTGRVLEAESGSPIQYFEILTFSGHGTIPNSTEDWHEAQRIYTEDGSFRLEKLPVAPGRCSVVVRVPGFGTGTANLTIAPEVTEADATIMVSEGLTVSGMVVDQNDMPVEGAEIIFGPPFETRLATTKADGSFRASGLPPELGKSTSDSLVLMESLTAFHPEYPPVSVPVPRGKEKQDVRLKFGPSGSIAVSVTQNGKPVSMAEVYVNVLLSGQSISPCMGLMSKPTDGNRTLMFSGLTPGPCQFSTKQLEGKGAKGTVEIVAGQTTPLHIDLGGPRATLRGTVLHDGIPPEEGGPVIYESETATGTVELQSMINPVDGTWRLDDVPAGSGTLTFQMRRSDEVRVVRTLEIDLNPGEEQVVDINHGGSDDEAHDSADLGGTVTINGAPPLFFQLEYKVTKGSTTLKYSKTISDSIIEWSIEDVAAGDGTLSITAYGEQSEFNHISELMLGPDEVQKLEIDLTVDDKKVVAE